MKTIIVIRHTKSDWSNLLPDFDRPIREDRKEDTRAIAKEIEKKGPMPQAIISSPAKRTLQTAKILCDKWKFKFKDVSGYAALYEGTTADILAAVKSTDEKYDVVAVICHNPGITAFVNQYSGVRIDNVPTTGAVGIRFDVSHWKEIQNQGKMQWFLQPKSL